MTKKILAHDLGTGGNKAALFDADGTLIGSVFVPYSTLSPAPGLYEQRPNDWFQAVAESTQTLLTKTKTDPRDIAGLALSGHSLGAVPLDGSGNLLLDRTPIWSDRRAEREATEFFRQMDPDRWYTVTGNGFPAPHYTVFKILWYRNHEPAMFEKARLFLGTKDYVNFCLTGKSATDPSYASGSGVYSLIGQRYDSELTAASGLDEGLLPAIIPSTATVGTLTRQAAAATGLAPDTAVFCGGVDNACMALGAGAFKPGRLYASLGSSSWIALCGDRPTLDLRAKSYVFTHVVPDMFTSALAVFSSGTTFRWIRDQLCRDLFHQAESEGLDVYDLMTAEAAESPIGARGLLMNPSLAGGTLLDQNPDMRGGFAMMDLSHTRGDLLRAAMEGIAMSLRTVLDALRRVTPTDRRMIAVGGGTHSDLWRQIYADVMKTEMVKTNIGQNAAALGAAAVAACGAGLWPSFDRIDSLLREEALAVPIPENVRQYDAVFRRYLEFSERLGQLNDTSCPPC